MKEVSLERYAGPYADIPYKDRFIQSPIGLVPKAENQTRLIFHLSYEFKQSGNPSVNACTPRDKCSVKYHDLDDAVKKSLALIRSIQGHYLVLKNGHKISI